MELFKLFGTIALNGVDETHSALDSVTEKASGIGSKIASGVGTVAKTVGKVAVGAVTVASTAVAAIGKAAVSSYADYEQLVGGVDTLFKDSSAKVQEYAANAYQTAGLSANEYMETVTSFSASLLQSLGNDTQAAADYADMAIIDMADNANKMGTDMAAIQNAYQGFAKQNYTMLDNLKLGYGGTKTEMERLIADANRVKEANGEMANLSIESFADVTEAIHIIQTEMGITGTTAAEASSTISGSLASAKSAWQNLLTGFADGNQDLSVLMKNFTDSAITVTRNLVPRIAEALSGISEALPMIISVIATELPGIMESLLPGLVDGAVALAVGLAQMLPSLVEMVFVDLPYLISKALSESSNPAIASLGSLFLDIGELWRENLLPAISSVGSALGGLWNAVQPVLAIFPKLFSETTGLTSGFDVFRTICFAVEEALQFVADKISEVAAWIADHSQQIQDVITALWEGVQFVWETIGQPIWDLIRDCVGIVYDVFAAKMPEIKEFVRQCFSDIQVFWENHLKPCFDAIGKFIRDTLAPIFKQVFEGTIKKIVDDVFKAIKGFWENTLKPVFVGITDFLTGVFTGNWQQAWEGLRSIAIGVINGIISSVEGMVNSVIAAANRLVEGVNNILSKVSGALGTAEVQIPTISEIELPKLEKGGVLKRGQIGLLEGNGAEAVVPLEKNSAWISAVAKDMNSAGIGGNSEQTQEIIYLLQTLIDILPDAMRDAVASIRLDINNREFGRMVRSVT